ncbi:MAG: penicillin acylase family protein [Nitrospira sp. LK265]|nr:penicillin acylase family protein [Nitrospira sp. LK265]
MKRVVLPLVVVLLILAAGFGYAVITIRASLPMLDGKLNVMSLQEPVTVTSDAYGIPTITARSREDATRALGYVTARDRLFQMDLSRRTASGRLAEVFGETMRETDVKQRTFGFGETAGAIAARLPQGQRAVLEAYTEGVNEYLAQMETPPFEFALLGYEPDPWKVEDSLLILLGIFQMLSGTEDDERMRTVMEQTLPSEVVSFLVPDSDPYTEALLDGKSQSSARSRIPVQALAALRRPVDQLQAHRTATVRFQRSGLGSNGWAVRGAKTADGRSILANDMHLDMAVPNILYRVQLRYEQVDLTGVVVPGIPVVVAGTNGLVAWGVTNVEGDFLDLVRLEINPVDSSEYRTPEGWKRFTSRREIIKVKGAQDSVAEFKETIWGPVSQDLLLRGPVAVRWTALDPEAVDLGQLAMDRVRSVSEAIAVMNRAGGPANNVILADSAGHIAWTYTGKIPMRRGFNGSVSVSWADGRVGWTRYISPEAIPRIVDPPSGFVVSANQRMLDASYPYVVGHSFANGYRAFRIVERLEAMTKIRERDLFDLQLDSTTQLHEFYRRLAQRLLTDAVVEREPSLAKARLAFEAWSGKADLDSRGFPLVVRFHDVLSRLVFTPYLSSCRERDPQFTYDGDLDTPLRHLLTVQIPELNPDPEHFASWSDFMLNAVRQSVQELESEHRSIPLKDLTWGHVNRVRMLHPLAEALPLLGNSLNMPDEPASGCGQCVRVMEDGLGATQRLVVAPGHQGEGILHMPGGQSGHPLSPHYRDQHQYWSEGLPLPLLAGTPVHTLTLVPHSRTTQIIAEQKGKSAEHPFHQEEER